MSSIQFRLEEQPNKKIEANLLYVTMSKDEGDWCSILHTHPFTEFFYVMHGRGYLLLKEHTCPLKEDDLVVVNPGIEHTEGSHQETPLEYIVLGIEGIELKFEDNSEGYAILNSWENRNEVLGYLLAMARELEQKPLYYELTCRDLMEVLLVYLIRHTPPTLSIASTQRTNKECDVIKRYIDSNYRENITLDRLAEIAHMNKYYLVHSFGKYMGISPINYLLAKRVAESKSLLASTNYSISQIASMIGFSSQSYFSQAFRKAMGETPGGYRKRIRKEKEP